jgi:hypothetical protein
LAVGARDVNGVALAGRDGREFEDCGGVLAVGGQAERADGGERGGDGGAVQSSFSAILVWPS